MAIWGAVVLNIVKEAVGNFEYSLVCNILVGPKRGQVVRNV